VSEPRITLYAIPFSTNVERVALALGHKRLAADVVMLDPDNRSRAVAVSGQPLVPVLDVDGEVLVDSSRIIERLEELAPEPALFPGDPARRAEVRVFVDWFDRVWKRPPNRLDDVLSLPGPDAAEVELLQAEMRGSLDVFEQLLTGREYLAGDEFSAADCSAYPFLKYGLHGAGPDDDESFHHVLADNLALRGGYPGIEAWIRRADGRPRVAGI
jgi:glutathione S-transferase